MPVRCAAAPSSTGAGIWLQSTSSKFRWVISSAPRPHQAALLPTPIALLLGLAFVVELLAFCNRQLQFGASPLVEIELERDQGHALAVDRAHQLVDLPTMEQQLARPLGLVIEAVALKVFGNG